MPPRGTMRALTMTGLGGLDRLLVQDVPHPGPPGQGQALIRIRTAGLNRIDLFILGGLPKARYDFPHVLGADGAGLVEAVGEGVSNLTAGDRVLINPGLSCGRCDTCLAGENPFCRQFGILGEHFEGTLAEYVLVPAVNLARIPGTLDWPEAAAFPLATLTAWRMLMTRARLRPGETVLIWGIGGGVALAALQIARLAGARVIVTSSAAAKLQVAERLGADLLLDHTTADVAREVRALTGSGADVVVDSVGEKTWDASLRALRPGGRLVICGATTGPMVAVDLRRLFWYQWQILGSTMGTQREFGEVVALAGQGRLRPVVDAVLPLADAPAAFARLAAGQQIGKLVIEVTP